MIEFIAKLKWPNEHVYIEIRTFHMSPMVPSDKLHPKLTAAKTTFKQLSAVLHRVVPAFRKPTSSLHQIGGDGGAPRSRRLSTTST